MTTLYNTLAGIANNTVLTAGSGGNSGGSAGNFFDVASGTCTVLTGQNLSSVYTSAMRPSVSASTSSYVGWTISGTEVHWRAYIKVNSLPPATARLVRVYNSATILAEFRLSTAGQIILTRGSDGQTISQTDSNTSTGTVYRIGFDLDSTTGEVHAFLGESLSEWSTVTHFVAGDSYAATTQIRFGLMFTANQTYSGVDFASFMYDDTAFPGPSHPTLALTDDVGVTDPGPGAGDLVFTIGIEDSVGVTDEATTDGGYATSDEGSVLDDAATVLAGGIYAIYGLQESSGSTTAGDVSGAGGRPRLTLTQTGPVGEGTADAGFSGIMPEGTAWKFTPTAAGGLTLGSPNARVYLGGDYTFFCQFAWTGAGIQSLMSLGSDTGQRIGLTVSSGQVIVTQVSPLGETATVAKSAATNDNRPHFACVVSRSGTLYLYVDLLAPASGSPVSGMTMVEGATIGGLLTTDPHQIAWVGSALQAFTEDEVYALALLATGGAERSDLRVSRILHWLGLSGDLVADTGMSDVAYIATGDAQALDVIHEAEAVEQGVFIPTGDGRYQWQSRSRRYNLDPVLTLTADQVDASIEVTVDTSSLINDVTVSRPAGRTYRARNPASVAVYGSQGDERTIYAATDDDLMAAADWLVYRYGDIGARIPRLTVDLLAHPEIAAPVMALEVSNLIRVTGLPSTLPSGSSVDLFVEGFEESISATQWLVTIATSPANIGPVCELDTSDLDSDSTVLAY